MNRLEQSEKADELISFLAAFDVSYADARTIMYSAFERIRTMNADDYKKTGEQLSGFITLMREAPNGPTN